MASKNSFHKKSSCGSKNRSGSPMPPDVCSSHQNAMAKSSTGIKTLSQASQLKMNPPCPVNPPCAQQASSCLISTPSASSRQSSNPCGQSTAKTCLDYVGPDTIVSSMDKKFEKYRKKIQKESFRLPKRCKALSEMLSKPPWSAPERPKREIKSCRRPKTEEINDAAESQQQQYEMPQKSSKQPFGLQLSRSKNMSTSVEIASHPASQIQGSYQNARNGASLQNQVSGNVSLLPANGSMIQDSCCGSAPPPPPPPPPASNSVSKKKKSKEESCKFKEFSSPGALRNKLNLYFEIDPNEKDLEGDLLPYYDGTVDLTSCLARGAKEGVEPWELGTLVCEHPDLQGMSVCGGGCGGQESNPSPCGGSAQADGQAEFECFKSIMPSDLTCQQQTDYLQCMGANEDVIQKFQALQQEPRTSIKQESNNGVTTQPCGGAANGSSSIAGPVCPCDPPPPIPTGPVCPCDTTSSCVCDQDDGQQMPDDMVDGNYQAYVTKMIDEANESFMNLGGSESNQAEMDEDDEIDLKNLAMFGPPAVEKRRTMAETFKLYRDHLANIRRRYFGAVCKFIDDVEDMTPETAAAMVITEEQNMKMKAAPAKFYEYLYPDQSSTPLLKVGDVASPEYLPEGVNNIVVPLVPPMLLETREFPGLEDPAMLDSPRVIQIGPSPNLADEPDISEGKAPADIIEAVTGQSDIGFVPADDDEEDEEDGGGEAYEFDVKLNQAMPPHYSRFQLRGSQAPNWFPGYYVAMPSRFGVSVNEKIGNVLERAWEETQPESVKPGGGATIIGY